MELCTQDSILWKQKTVYGALLSGGGTKGTNYLHILTDSINLLKSIDICLHDILQLSVTGFDHFFLYFDVSHKRGNFSREESVMNITLSFAYFQPCGMTMAFPPPIKNTTALKRSAGSEQLTRQDDQKQSQFPEEPEILFCHTIFFLRPNSTAAT